MVGAQNFQVNFHQYPGLEPIISSMSLENLLVPYIHDRAKVSKKPRNNRDTPPDW